MLLVHNKLNMTGDVKMDDYFQKNVRKLVFYFSDYLTKVRTFKPFLTFDWSEAELYVFICKNIEQI